MPVTVTDSEKVTVTLTTSPTLYVPFAEEADTEVTVGAVVSMTRALLAPKEFAAPGVARVKVASLPTASLIVPEFKAKEVVAT